MYYTEVFSSYVIMEYSILYLFTLSLLRSWIHRWRVSELYGTAPSI